MYCLRYFLLVLLFFPFPTAPPFLVFLFLISMTIQHRPCAYCSLLLSAILLSTCSWNLVSVDVSPVYSSHHVEASTGSFLSSILSFFISNDEPPTHTSKNHTGFKSIKAPNRDHKPEPINRCWCYSNHGRLFEPVSPQNNKASRSLDLPVKGHQAPSSSERPSDSSSSQVLKGSIVDEETSEDFEPDRSTRKQSRRPLTSLFSPLWKPLVTKSLSSVTRSPSIAERQLSAHSSSSSPEIIPTPGPTSSRVSKIPSKPSPPKACRSSFSRTPLIYSHVIDPLIQFIKPHLPLPMIQRTMLIIKYNVIEVSSKIVEFEIIRESLNFVDSFKLPFFGNLLYHYRANQPYEIRLNHLIGLRVFLGTRA
ncbi:uncharacterized protein VP01_249g7 [Puccinia sorghi]|uniref:Uncharacterized protein n=1 Tax=Puccinia sorghi TaxID=27349 RepID=A0A0L6V6C3_9BASI|nr:uncharacterized protein VP01_249g7 [Puccinia sorghi]